MISLLNCLLTMGSAQSHASAAEVVSQWNSEPKERLLCDCGRAEIIRYLEAVDKIRLTPNNGEFDRIISMAVARLMNEFQAVLTRQIESAIGRSSVAELSSSMNDSTSYQFRYEDYVPYEAPTKEVIDYLRNIAQRMDTCGHLDACIQVYVSARKGFVNKMIKGLGIEELQAGDSKRFLVDDLRMKIERWIQAAKVCTKILFAKEKQLAKQIFLGIGTSSTHNECFLSIVEDSAVNLFKFAKAVSTSYQSSERLEVILVLFQGFSSLAQDVNALFPFESARRIRDSTATISSRLQEAVKRMLSDFENAVLIELSIISDDGSRVHSLTKYVMEYVDLIVKHRKLLNFVSKPSLIIEGKRLPDVELQNPQNLSPLTLHLILILAVLQLNLEKKSKNFKDASLGDLFLMNNFYYVVQRIERSKELKETIGSEYVNKLNENVKQAMSSYQTSACDKFLYCLKDDGLYVSRCFIPRVSSTVLRKRVKAFNSVIDEINRLRSSWEVTDSKLRDDLRHMMLDKLLPTYESFLKKFRRYLDSGKQTTNCIHFHQKIHIKYSIEDLADLVRNNLFTCPPPCPSPELSSESFLLGDGRMKPLPEEEVPQF